MSIMDHDPKYAKLRAWRETTYRKGMIDKYRWYIEKCFMPPPALCRWVGEAWREEQGLMPVLTPMRQMTVRLYCLDATIQPWRSIQETFLEKEQKS